MGFLVLIPGTSHLSPSLHLIQTPHIHRWLQESSNWALLQSYTFCQYNNLQAAFSIQFSKDWNPTSKFITPCIRASKSLPGSLRYTECKLRIVDPRPSGAWTLLSFQSYLLRFFSVGPHSTLLTALAAWKLAICMTALDQHACSPRLELRPLHPHSTWLLSVLQDSASCSPGMHLTLPSCLALSEYLSHCSDCLSIQLPPLRTIELQDLLTLLLCLLFAMLRA